MALVKCKECKKEVAKSAKACPYCGVDKPSSDTSSFGVTQGVLVIIFIVFLINLFSEDDEKKGPQKTPEQIAKEKSEKAKQCRTDLLCYGAKYNFAASVRCPIYIEKMAKHDFKWVDGWAEPKFSHYRWKDKELGIVTHIGDKLKLQNGFGAWGYVTYECDYDGVNESVIDVRVSKGRI